MIHTHKDDLNENSNNRIEMNECVGQMVETDVVYLIEGFK